MLKYIFIIFIFFFVNTTIAQESLTLKQRLDRIERDLNDLMKAFYTGSKKSYEITTQSSDDISKFNNNLTALDLRIYEIEKNFKKLNNELINQLFEEIDDLNILTEKLREEVSFLSNQVQSEKIEDQVENKENEKTLDQEIKIEEQNILGTLVIKSEDLSDSTLENKNKLNKSIDVKKNLEKNENQLTSKEEFQKAYDLIRAQKWDNAIIALENFINHHQEETLSGSAHYWIGKIYLMKKEYRKSAVILTEGYQKYPNTIKAPEMLDLLSESLILINKKKEACNILKIFIDNFSNNNLSIKIEDKIVSLNCNNNSG